MEKQVPGVRYQVSGVRSQNEGHQLSADCLLRLKCRRSRERDLRYPCFLPTIFEGGGDGEGSWQAWEPWTRCRRPQGKEELVRLKNERMTRECL